MHPNPSVAKTKRSTLLSDGKGPSALNHLIDSMLADIMQDHVDLVKRLEVRKQPIAHLIVRWIKEYHELLKTKFIDGTIYGPLHTPVRDFYLDGNGGDEPATVAAVDNISKNFADALRSSSMIRLKPLFSHIGQAKPDDSHTCPQPFNSLTLRVTFHHITMMNQKASGKLHNCCVTISALIMLALHSSWQNFMPDF